MKNYMSMISMIFLIMVIQNCSDSKNDTDIQGRDSLKKIETANDINVQNKNKTVSTLDGRLPELWKINNTIVRPKETMEFYSKSFGGKVTGIENNYISVSEPHNYYRFQINVIKAQDEKEAAKIYDKLHSTSANKEKFILSGEIIYEVLARENFVEECRSILKK